VSEVERTRETLLARYARLAANPYRRDPGGQARAAILRGLRGRLLPGDRDLLLGAVETYEFLPPGRREVAANLRAEALLALAEVDDGLALFQAVRLIDDEHTAPGTGEPALTAASLLGASGQALPLYGRLLRDDVPPAVAARCFRGLVEAPPEALLPLAERWRDRDEQSLLGLLDLLLEHPEAERFAGFLGSFLRESRYLDLVRYLAAAIVAGRRPALIELLREQRDLEGPRGEAVRDGLALLPGL
jgi:hypothetical protein